MCELLRLRLPVLWTRFSNVSIHHCFSSLLAFLFVATAVGEDMLFPHLLPDQIVPLTLVLSNKNNSCRG